MDRLNLLVYKRITKVQIKYCVLFIFILLFSLAISEVLYFDTRKIDATYGSIYELVGKDKEVFYYLYFNGLIGLQGYFFGFIFSLVLSLIYFVFSGFLMFDSFKEEIAILLIRTSSIKKSQGVYLKAIFINIFISSLVGLALLPLLNFAINVLIDTKLDLMSFNYVTIIFYFLITLSYMLVIYLINLSYFKNEKIISSLREIF